MNTTPRPHTRLARIGRAFRLPLAGTLVLAATLLSNPAQAMTCASRSVFTSCHHGDCSNEDIWGTGRGQSRREAATAAAYDCTHNVTQAMWGAALMGRAGDYRVNTYSSDCKTVWCRG